MDKYFETSFETLFSEFPATFGTEEFPYLTPILRGSLREIRNYISSHVDSNTKSIRSDAKFYLLNNYAYMILLPYLMSQDLKDGSYPLTDDFTNPIKSDIDEIIKYSTSMDGEQISSHTISRAINDLWGKLFSTSEAFWTKPDRY